MKPRCILVIIVIICIISCMSFIFYKINRNKINKNEQELSNKNIEEKEEVLKEHRIEEIKNDLGYNNTDKEIYEIKKEYDGREVLSIKPNIQYKVAMAGAIKNAKPKFSEIDQILGQAPNKSGIWITNKSRDRFLNMLKDVTTTKYTIDNNGFLIQESNNNEIDENIKKAIDGNKIYSIDINKVSYLVDEVTGQIEEYPFEEIDPEAPYELFEADNAVLYVITENTYKKIDNKYIIEEVLNNMMN